MAVFRWPSGFDPMEGFRAMQRELERLAGRAVGAAGRTIGGGVYPPVNVYSSDSELLVEAEVPGLTREQVELSITGETLVIRGEKLPAGQDNATRHLRQERGVGEFSRTIVLPEKVDADGIQAKLADGILTVRLPKAESAVPRRIQVS